MFAALRTGATYEEIDSTFGWEHVGLVTPAHMLLAAFEKPEPRPCAQEGSEVLNGCPEFEGDWITNTLLYHSTSAMKEPLSRDFVRRATKYFGFTFVNTGYAKPSASDPPSAETSNSTLPEADQGNDILIISRAHLRTTWEENTFSLSTPYQGEFRTVSGESRKVEMQDSAVSNYLYAQTDQFEAAALPGEIAYMIVVLPAAGADIQRLEEELAEQPEALDAAMKLRPGSVSMPSFHIRRESHLRAPMEAMGIRQVFVDLGDIVKIPKSHLTEVNQKIDLVVDRSGIRADAGTVAGAVYGGIMSVPQPFHMHLNRPFVFLIRDQTTNALLFIGAVMEPDYDSH
jgi:serpin B